MAARRPGAGGAFSPLSPDEEVRPRRGMQAGDAPWGTILTAIGGALILLGVIAVVVLAGFTLSNTNTSNSRLRRLDEELLRVDSDLQRHYSVEEIVPQTGGIDLIGQEMVVANFCSKATPVGNFGCTTGSRCFIPISEFESIEDYVTLDPSGSRFNMVVKNEYKLRVIIKGRTLCPFHRVRINLVANLSSVETVVAFGFLGAHQSLNLTTGVVLDTDDTLVGIEVEKADENADVSISLDCLITKNTGYDDLARVTTADLAKPVAWIPARPSTAPSSPSLQFPLQYPTSSTVYPWTSTVIPNSPINGSLPAGIPNNWGHKKQGSVPESIGIFMNLLIEQLPGPDPQLSLFLTNREERGLNERRKAVYMSALRACVVKVAYKEKTRSFLNRVYSDVTTYGKPLLSSFKDALVDFLLDVHVGTAQHPQDVRTYFSEFIEFIGVGSPIATGRNARVLLGKRLTPMVRAYFTERNAIVIGNQDSSSIVYYWHIAGLAPEGLVMETIHNAIAFEQFLNILIKLVIDKISGTPQPVVGTIQYNFFAQHTAVASDPVARLNVVREVMRLTVPNAVSFSKVVDPAQPGVFITSRLLHQSLMVSATGTLLGNAAAYFGYRPSLYSSFIDYNTSISGTTCSADDSSPQSVYNPNALFTRANVGVDTQTFFDIQNDKLIPVFTTPIYTTFGLGYRRCPGEIFVYDIVDQMLEIFAPLTWFIGPAGTPATTCVAPFTCPANNIYATRSAPAA